MSEETCILVCGVGETASAVARRLFAEDRAVAIHQATPPRTLRRKMAFSDAWFDGAASLDGVEARRADLSSEFLLGLRARQFIPLLTQRFADVVERWPWDVIVTARGEDGSPGDYLADLADLTIGLGAGFRRGRRLRHRHRNTRTRSWSDHSRRPRPLAPPRQIRRRSRGPARSARSFVRPVPNHENHRRLCRRRRGAGDGRRKRRPRSGFRPDQRFGSQRAGGRRRIGNRRDRDIERDAGRGRLRSRSADFTRRGFRRGDGSQRLGSRRLSRTGVDRRRSPARKFRSRRAGIRRRSIL